MTEIRSVDVATLSAVEDIKKLVHQDLLGVTPKSFVIKVPHENVNHSQPEWYMPLQAVFTPEKSTKVRLVVDSSSKGHDALPLNDNLEKGPNYINSLPNVLAAWRWDEYAYSGDIRKMFNQALMHPDDQIFHRFQWRKNQHEPPPPLPSMYQWLRLNFGDKPSPDITSNAIKILLANSLRLQRNSKNERTLMTSVDPGHLQRSSSM